MYECFHCGMSTVIWDADFSFEDYGEDEEVYTFSEYGWRFALGLLRYIGCNAEEA